MVDTALPQAKSGVRAYVIEEVMNIEILRPLLEGERAYAAYALSQLDPKLFPKSRWWLARGPEEQAPSAGSGQALVLQARSGLGAALLTLGDPEGVDAILSLHPGPRFSFATFKPEHLSVAKGHYLLARQVLMQRMAARAESFRPGERITGKDVAMIRLLGRDVARLNRLYASEGEPSSYASRDIEEGVYYGVIMDGRLVSVAGTHAVSPSQGVAIVGNVFTHPEYRGQGLATMATGIVTAHLLRECSWVLLTVATTNKAAIRAYEKLGYQVECTLYETPALRKEPLGALAWLRRRLARWRGGEGKEVVVRKS